MRLKIGKHFNSDKKNTENMKNTENTENKKFIRVFFRTILGIFKIAVPAGVILAIAAVIFVLAGTPDVAIDDLQLSLTSSICYRDSSGKIVEYEKISSNQSRFWVALSKVPQDMKDAFVSIEDERFYSHSGFDMKRTVKAVMDYMQRGSSAVGGSTITQQLIKNVTGNKDTTPVRKIQEIWLAYNLERKMSKDQILEMYVNTIYLGQGVNGVQTASKLYFNKDVSELSLAECASIAGITQNPSRYDPFLKPEENKTRQEVILKKMLELGVIDNDKYEKAKAEQLNFKKGNMRVTSSTQSYFTDQVLNDVINDLVKEKGLSEVVAKKKIYDGGYKIIATIDPKIQDAIDKVFEDPSNFPKSPVSTYPQGAMVILEPDTGYIKGLIGGIGKKPGDFSLNRATQTTRQPGSSIKPLAVYAPAVESGLIFPSKIYTDQKVTFDKWSPKNYYNGFYGEMTVRKAVQISVNTIPVQILNELGIDKSYDFLKNNFKITSLDPLDHGYAALALGGLTKGISVKELTAAYAAFPNKGVYTVPTTYVEVLDSYNKKVLSHKKKTSVAMSEKTAATITDMLKSVVTGGTGVAAAIPGASVAGKTGTTDSDKDRWFVGFTPNYAAAVWYGFDQPRDMGYIKSTNPALAAWRKVMAPVQSGSAHKDFPVVTSNENIRVSVCGISGKLPTDTCRAAGTVVTESFASGKVPSGYCSASNHKPTENIDNDTVDIPVAPIETAVPGTHTPTPEPNSNSSSVSPSPSPSPASSPKSSAAPSATPANTPKPTAAPTTAPKPTAD